MSQLTPASAPGKLMVSGEYAVLEGAVAIVASVDVRAYACWCETTDRSPSQTASSPQNRPLPPEAVLARRLAEEFAGTVQAELTIDASDLRRSGKKLGLGSSAAAAAAAVGAVLATHGHDLSQPACQQKVLELALAGHKAIAPEGSGADVAAASLGGFVRFQLEGGALAEARRVSFPKAVTTRIVWTGKEARTSTFVRAVREFEARDAKAYGLIRDRLTEQASQFADAIEQGDTSTIVSAAGGYGRAMGELGEAAGVSILTPELKQIAELAERSGGSAKPSGAGGGDVAIAFFTSETDAASFEAACKKAALEPLDLSLGAPGVQTEVA